MLFQTFEFAIFFLIVCITVLVIPRLFPNENKWKNVQMITVLAASLFFYAWGSIPHTFLFVGVIIWTYFMGRVVERKHSKALLALSVVVGFTPLFICKYLPFVAGTVLDSLGGGVPWFVENISLPVGISFYSFQAVAYVLDVYKKKCPAEKDIIAYGLFISFFPQLVAGPIMRASDLLGQLKQGFTITSENAAAGLRLMAYGLFLKVFVADTLGAVVDVAFGTPTSTSGAFFLLAMTFFSVQIYCDFNGYTTIARGTALVMGIELTENFKHPYLSSSVSNFWRRWHISLTSWFRDYVYFPLGGSRCGKARTSLNILITFLVSGIWHGAGWNFIIWGLLNGMYQVVERLLGIGKKSYGFARSVFGCAYTCILIGFSWIFFRAQTLGDAFLVIGAIATIPTEIAALLSKSTTLASLVPTNGTVLWNIMIGFVGIIAVAGIGIFEKKRDIGICDTVARLRTGPRWACYLAILFISLCFGSFASSGDFIYFRF